MNLLAAIIGILLPTAIGWCAVNLIEQNAQVLTRIERFSWSLILGPTLSMLIVFLLAATGVSHFSFAGFIVPMTAVLLILGGICWKQGCLLPSDALLPSLPEPRGWLRIGISLFVLWTAFKIFAGAYDLISVPTYWDDSFNNWNMRGKIFYETKMPILEIPVGNGVVQTAQGVSSYPPALPLMKTWLSVIRGSWQEPLINGIQLLWFAGLLLTFYATLRRRFRSSLALFGTSLVCSLPLLLIHAMNPYAEIFLASHLLLSVTALVHAASASDERSLRGWMRLFGFSLGLLLFTKNEATLLYGPILLILAGLVLLSQRRRWILKMPLLRAGLSPFLIALTLVLPWIAFKWMHGLTFGNAKAVSGIEIRFSMKALEAIWHHVSHEPNEMFLPLLLPLMLLASGKRCFRMPEAVLSLFVISTFSLQMFLFLFVGALETEAVLQTGLSRGLIQISPLALLLIFMLGSKLLHSEHR